FPGPSAGPYRPGPVPLSHAQARGTRDSGTALETVPYGGQSGPTKGRSRPSFAGYGPRAHASRSPRDRCLVLGRPWARGPNGPLCPPFCNGPVEVKPQSRNPLAENSLLSGVGAGPSWPRPPPDGVRKRNRPSNLRDRWSQAPTRVGSGLT